MLLGKDVRWTDVDIMHNSILMENNRGNFVLNIKLRGWLISNIVDAKRKVVQMRHLINLRQIVVADFVLLIN